MKLTHFNAIAYHAHFVFVPLYRYGSQTILDSLFLCSFFFLPFPVIAKTKKMLKTTNERWLRAYLLCVSARGIISSCLSGLRHYFVIVYYYISFFFFISSRTVFFIELYSTKWCWLLLMMVFNSALFFHLNLSNLSFARRIRTLYVRVLHFNCVRRLGCIHLLCMCFFSPIGYRLCMATVIHQ